MVPAEKVEKFKNNLTTQLKIISLKFQNLFECIGENPKAKNSKII